MILIRYALLLLAVALVGGITVVSAGTDANQIDGADKLPADSAHPAHVLSEDNDSGDTKRFLRKESKTTTNHAGDGDDAVEPAADEERAVITRVLKSSLYKLLAAVGINPQTVLVKLGLRNGNAPYLFHRFYNSYQRWYATYGPRV